MSKQSIFLSLSLDACLVLAACGGGGGDGGDDPPGSGEAPDTTAPVPTLMPGYTATTPIVVTFNESMDPESLQLAGSIAAMSDGGVWSGTVVENDTLTLTALPTTFGTPGWESGVQTLGFRVADKAGNMIEVPEQPLLIRLQFENFQPAVNVIGQRDFFSSEDHQGGAAGAGTFADPHGNAGYDEDRDWLFLSDYQAARVLVYLGLPGVDGANANHVIGQENFTDVEQLPTGASSLAYPAQASVHDGRLIVTQAETNRVSIFNDIDALTDLELDDADVVLGQGDKNGDDAACSANGFDIPVSHHVTPDGKLLVADLKNHRVLVWNQVPEEDGAAADLVLGQADFDSCESDRGEAASLATLHSPSAVWSDEVRIVVADRKNNRVLIWQAFPTENGQPADIVLGQEGGTLSAPNDDNGDGSSDETPSARTLHAPYAGVYSNGIQLFVADTDNNRVLVWNAFPGESFQPADVVLGQPDFTHGEFNAGQDLPGANTLGFPSGVMLVRNRLIVTDAGNARYLVFESK